MWVRWATTLGQWKKKHIKCKHEGVTYYCDKCELAENTGGGLK